MRFEFLFYFLNYLLPWFYVAVFLFAVFYLELNNQESYVELMFVLDNKEMCKLQKKMRGLFEIFVSSKLDYIEP